MHIYIYIYPVLPSQAATMLQSAQNLKTLTLSISKRFLGWAVVT